MKIETRFYQEPLAHVFEINGTKFALFDQEKEYEEDFFINLPDHNVIFVNSLNAHKKLTVQAKNVMVMAKLLSNSGELKISAAGSCINMNAIHNRHKIFANHGNYNIGCSGRLLKSITDQFMQAVEQKNGQIFVEALFGAYQLFLNPEKGKCSYEPQDAFALFEIPLAGSKIGN